MKNNYLKLATLTVFLTAGSIANADLLYNPIENSWEFGNYSDEYMYNSFENEWSYEPSGSQLQYNPMENSWDYFYEGY